MIASVNGEVLVRRPDHVVVDANGVGYRLAVSAETLKSVPARGKRTAERIIVELREKVAGEIDGGADGPALAADEEDSRALAREGLLNLGYTQPEVEKLLSRADGESPEEIVQSALRSAAGAKAARFA